MKELRLGEVLDETDVPGVEDRAVSSHPAPRRRGLPAEGPQRAPNSLQRPRSAQLAALGQLPSQLQALVPAWPL
eukprot:5951220-Lingulodinium_polyedra.AAC.1